MRQLYVSVSLLALAAVTASPVLAYETRTRFDVAQGFHFNPASHASVGYLLTLGGLPGDMPVTTPDGATKKVAMVLSGLDISPKIIGMGGRVSAAMKERFKYANQPNKISHLSFTLECWAYDPYAKRFYKSISSEGKVLSGTMPKEKLHGHVNPAHMISSYTRIDLNPAGDVTNPVNHDFSFSIHYLAPQTIEVASSSTYKEIVSVGQ